MLRFQAPHLSGTSVEYSPFYDNRLALGTAANFGIVGPGRVFSLEILPSGQFAVQSSFETREAVLSVAYSEINANQLAIGCGDGTISLVNTAQPSALNTHFPTVKEHSREVASLDWNILHKHEFCSASWDGSVLLWTADGRLLRALTTPNESLAVHAAKFSPHCASVLASAGANGQIALHDTRQPRIAAAGLAAVPHSGECLTLDWNKYRPHTLAVAGSDGVIRIRDTRNLQTAPLAELVGHELAVKSVKWSPHSPHHLLSASYDMTVGVWTDQSARLNKLGPSPNLLRRFARHTEFVTACDWSLWGEPGWVASTSYDRSLLVWKV